MEIPFVGGAYEGRSRNLDAQECINLYPVLNKEGGKSVAAMMNTPGLTEFCDLGTGAIRGMEGMPYSLAGEIYEDYLYAVLGNTVYRIDTDGNSTEMTGTLSTSSGRVSMKNNGTQIAIIDGIYGYILEGTTLTAISDADFPTPSSLVYQGGYFIISRGSTGQFYISALYDGTSWDALDYATAEGMPDFLQAVRPLRGNLWLLGKDSYEVWYHSGAADFPYERVEGAFNKVGCCAPNSAAEHLGLMAWLDDLRQVRQAVGYDAQIISPEQINYQFQQYSTVSDAFAFIYSQEGHPFYVLTFPTEAKSWAYDFSTGIWHRRTSDYDDKRHRANCYTFFNGMHLVGDYENGKIYKYDLDKYSDDGITLRRVRAAQVVHTERKRVFHHCLEIEFEAGTGLAVDDSEIGAGQDPQAMLEWSDDGGHTWSNQRWASIGKIGEYEKRARWPRLGSSRNRIYRVTVSDPVKTVILGAYLDATAGIS